VRTHLIHRPARDIIPPLGGARVSFYWIRCCTVFMLLLWYAKNEDGGDALSNEASSEGCHRDGAARACLQPHPRDEHYGHSAADGRDQGIVKVGKNSSRRHFL